MRVLHKASLWTLNPNEVPRDALSATAFLGNQEEMDVWLSRV